MGHWFLSGTLSSHCIGFTLLCFSVDVVVDELGQDSVSSNTCSFYVPFKIVWSRSFRHEQSEKLSAPSVGRTLANQLVIKFSHHRFVVRMGSRLHSVWSLIISVLREGKLWEIYLLGIGKTSSSVSLQNSRWNQIIYRRFNWLVNGETVWYFIILWKFLRFC